MADFNPDEFLGADDAGFDPDAFIADQEPEHKTSFFGAVNAGIGSVPGVKQIGAGINTAIDLVKHPGGSIADTYDAWRSMQNKKESDAFRDRPWTSGITSAAANIGVGALAGPAIESSSLIGKAAQAISPGIQKAASLPIVGAGESVGRNIPLMRQGLTNLSMATASAADQGDIADTGKIALEGALIGEAVNLAKKGVVKGVGALLKGGQNITDDLASWIGKSKIGKMIASENIDEPSGKFSSERAQDLQKTIDAGDPDFGSAASKLMNEARTSLGTSASSRLDQLSDVEKEQVAMHFAELLKERGAKGVSPAKVLSNWDDIVNRYTNGADKGTAMDLLKGVNKRDVKWLASAGAGIEDTNRVLGISDETLPEVKSMLSGAQQTRQAALEERMNRFGQSKSPTESAGTYQVDPSKLSSPEQEAYKLGKAAFEGRARIEGPGDFHAHPQDLPDIGKIYNDASTEALDTFYGKNYPQGETPMEVAKERIFSPSSGEEAAQRLDTYKAASKRANDTAKYDISDVLERARFWRDHLKSIEEAKIQSQGNAQETARLEKEAMKAKAALHSIGVGRSAMENAASGIGALSGGLGGMTSAAIGAAVGKPASKALFKTIDLAGAAGQRLSKVASIAERLATMDNQVGRAARWALSAEGDQAVVRMATLAKFLEENPQESGQEDITR